MKKYYLIAAVLLCGACSNDDEPQTLNTRENIEFTRSEEAIVLNSQYNLGSEVFDALLNQSNNQNFLFSPLSLSVSASIIANGASGDTQKEILKVLGYEGSELDQLNNINKKLITRLPELDNSTCFKMANALWYSTAFGGSLKSDFRSLLNDNYLSHIEGSEDIASDKTFATINDWCKTHTNGVIPSLLSTKPSPTTRFMIANALYFKGIWKDKFDSALTHEGSFHSENGDTKIVTMMRNKKMPAIGYGTDKYTAVSISFGNDAFSMLVILPDKGNSIAECLNAEEWKNIRQLATRQPISDNAINIQRKNLDITLPKFSLNSNIDFLSVLSSLGVKKLFNSSEADLTNCFESGEYFINSVNQISKIEIDEKGAVGASVSQWTGEASSDFVNLEELTVDRPFVFLITEQSTGSIIFIGKIGNLE